MSRKQRKSPRQYHQAEHKHPDDYAHDLNPHRMAGQNVGEHAPEDAPETVAASDDKEIRNFLLAEGFAPDEVREIPVVKPGGRLQQGRTYLDLRDPGREPFTATGEMTVPQGHWLVPKSHTPYAFWNRLRGLTAPERTI